MSALFEIFADLFAETIATNWPNRSRQWMQRKKRERRIRQLVRDYEWFEQLYNASSTRWAILNNDSIHRDLMDKEFMLTANLDLVVRNEFEKKVKHIAEIGYQARTE